MYRSAKNYVTTHNYCHEVSCLQCINFHQLTQIGCNLTRDDRLLDLNLTNQPETTNTQVTDEMSVHFAIHCLLSLARVIRNKTEKQIFKHARPDKEKMNQMLKNSHVYLNTRFQDCSMEENCCLFCGKLTEMHASCVKNRDKLEEERPKVHT